MRYKQEEKQYWFSGFLSVLSGITGAWIGNSYSMAVFSDSPHSLSDGFADWLAAIIMRKVCKKPGDIDRLRRNGTKIISVLLILSAIWIVWEASHRYIGSEYIVSPAWILLAGIITSSIDLTKIIIFLIAQSHNPNKMRSALIWHALFDLRRSEIITVIGALGVTAMLLVSFDVSGVFLTLDFVASVGLSIYILKIAKLLWQGKHEHRHINISAERWIIKKLTGFEIPHHHH